MVVGHVGYLDRAQIWRFKLFTILPLLDRAQIIVQYLSNITDVINLHLWVHRLLAGSMKVKAVCDA